MVVIEKRVRIPTPQSVAQPCGLKVYNHPQRIQLHQDCCEACQVLAVLHELSLG